MQTVEEFMADYFRARTAQLQSEANNRRPFRERFYADSCNWDSRTGSVERSGNEKVLSVSTSGETTYVVTEGTNPWPKLRYHLNSINGGWLITQVDGQCFACRGEVGSTECVCKGTGWIGQNNTLNTIKSHIDTLKGNNPRWFWRR